ncbi:MAG TPA: D-alanyl-D-alanine carboxypeptidase/D-alanyl-D-alanine-endopeptidase [Kofleriaceae bacterium]|nr:D-alanyl-D-alanine carboxypeptidase/D-alanyl-D-alanine-endopeptidase [Kofleriaceae bacterium]
MSWCGAILLAIAAATSIDTPRAASQPSDDDDGSAAGSNGSAAGSGSASGVLLAPSEPTMRRAWLTERLTAATTSRPALAGAKITAAVLDLETNQPLYRLGGDVKQNLASNAKLLTSTAALATLGNGFRWRTAVFAEKPPDATGTIQGDLYLRGRGDPMLSAAHLEELAQELYARGIRTIEGKLVIDTTYFDDLVEPPHFDEQPKERAGFRAPVASLGVARSAATVVVVANPGGSAEVTLEPDAGDYLRITKREVTSITQGRTRLRVDIKPKRDHVEYEVSGQIRVGEGSWDFRRRVDEPARFAGEVFRRALIARGITIRERGLPVRPVPPTAKQLAFHDSAPLAEIVRFMNKTSDNYVAESVLKTLGAETRTTPGPATWADGLAAVRAYLASIGIPESSYRIENGSGLFSATEVSADQLVKLLAAAHADYRVGPDLLGSLPIGGADGTLGRRWYGQPARGRVRAKTGTLDKVITLSGYVAVDSKRPIAFAILVNDIPAGQRAAARATIDDMVNVIAAYLGAR